MAELKDMMAYLIQHYPERMRHELSNARLTKMVYLGDWHQAITRGRQISDVHWYFDNYGPFVSDIEMTAREHPALFGVSSELNAYGQPKKLFTLKDDDYTPALSKEERASLDHIIGVTQKLYWNDFLKLVYATYPVASSERYSFLDLVEKAAEYNLAKKG
jgi:hypothetical protein